MSDANSSLESQQEKWSELVQRAATDPELKRRLFADPVAVLEAEGVAVPAGSRVQVTEEHGEWQCSIEPALKASAAAAGELSADDMRSVVGGGGKQSSTTEHPTESFSLSFGKILWTYTEQK
jgi:hypothetical protein